MKTKIILTITHKAPIPDLTDKVANRVWSLQGVEGAEVALDEEPQLAQPVNAGLVEAIEHLAEAYRFAQFDRPNMSALAQPASVDSIDTSPERVHETSKSVQVAQPASEPAAVSGWKLVPVDATRNQLVTGWHAIAGKLDHQSLAHLYGAMLAAAPQQGETK